LILKDTLDKYLEISKPNKIPMLGTGLARREREGGQTCLTASRKAGRELY
jgi:hypothetical protein